MKNNFCTIFYKTPNNSLVKTSGYLVNIKRLNDFEIKDLSEYYNTTPVLFFDNNCFVITYKRENCFDETRFIGEQGTKIICNGITYAKENLTDDNIKNLNLLRYNASVDDILSKLD